MKSSRLPAAVLLTLSMLAPVAGVRGAEAVLDRIPADSLGYLVVNNVKTTTAHVDALLKELGLGMMMPPGGVLDMIKAQSRIVGLDASGGLAVVLLDPQKFGADLVGMMGLKEGVAASQPKPSDIPGVMLVPGAGASEVFGPMALAVPGQDYYQLAAPTPSPIILKHSGGYVSVSGSMDAIKAMENVSRSTAAALPKEHAAAIAKSDFALHLNMKVAGPILDAVFKGFEKNMKAASMPAMMVGARLSQLTMLRALTGQVDEITITARITSTGLAVDALATFVAGGELSRAFAAVKAPREVKLNRLPNMPYVLASSQQNSQNDAIQQFFQEYTTAMMGQIPMGGKILKIAEQLQSQLTGVQMVMGGAPAGNGIFGIAIVCETKDTGAVKQALVDYASAYAEMMKGMFAFLPGGGPKLTIGHVEKAVTVEGIAADALVLSAPFIDEMDESGIAKVKKIMGEDKLRAFIAEVDDKTVVLSFGGSTAFLAETIKSARSPKPLLTAPVSATLAKYKADKTMIMMVLSAGNLMKVVLAGIEAMNPGMGGAIPFRLTTKEPVSFCAGLTDKSVHGVFYVPTKLVKEIYQTYQMVSMMRGGGGRRGRPGGVPPTMPKESF
ncbi:MAG: hypothetical protein J7M14_03665 [Planctomycetes bacterium]|nr:hypothetical protein [Planctomycetota bacterium]